MSSVNAECTSVRERLALLLYGELNFEEEERVESHLDSCHACRAALERQRVLHSAIDDASQDPAADLLWQCRTDLRTALAKEPSLPWWRQALHSFRHIRWAQPAGAVAMLAIGFLGAHLMGPEGSLGGVFGARMASVTDPGAAKVRLVEAGTDGQVRIVLDETRQRTVSGRLDDKSIQSLLFAAVRDQADPGLRVQSIGLLNNHAQSPEVRDALVFALSHDANGGVRMRALEGLKAFARDPQVQTALTQALLHDTNPGLRAQAVDLLTQGGSGSAGLDASVVGTLQELMSHEDNAYVRQRSESALQAVKASSEIF